jgi:hypothetical protein
MDPLSAIASVIAVLQLSSKVLGYLAAVKTSSKDQAHCAIEASNLNTLFLDLKSRLEGGDSSKLPYTAVRALTVENGPLDQFEEVLKTLEARLTDRGLLRTAQKALKWKFEKEEIAGILAQMERIKTRVGLALQMGHM